MKLILPIFALLTLASARGKNKPGQFEYSCRDKNCNGDRVDAWLLQACQGIGGSELTSWGGVYSSTGEVVGGTGICLCAHGQTKEHDYTISDDYPPGTATLRFNVDAPYRCQSKGNKLRRDGEILQEEWWLGYVVGGHHYEISSKVPSSSSPLACL